jgi:predicted Zn-dependent protease with MMP-like domain
MERRSVGTRADGILLGLYQGVPLPRRGSDYGNVLPDKITIYQESIEMIAADPDQIREQVRKTVLHELGHYFGIDDDRLHELGMG